MATARYRYGATRQIEYTPATAKTAGDVVKLDDNRAAVVITDLAASEKGAVYVDGVFDVDSASATTVAIGGEVYADISDSNKIIPTASKATGDFLAGVALVAKAAAELTCRIDLNAPRGTVSA